MHMVGTEIIVGKIGFLLPSEIPHRFAKHERVGQIRIKWMREHYRKKKKGGENVRKRNGRSV